MGLSHQWRPDQMTDLHSMVDSGDPILITGSNGVIGSKVVETLLSYGFKNLRCFVRPSSNLATLNNIIGRSDKSSVEVIQGNLLSTEHCRRATDGAAVIFHLAAG